MSEPESQQQLGRLAVERGLVTATQLREALEEQARRQGAGSQVPLGEILVDLGMVTRVQLEVLLEAQGTVTSSRQPIEGYELIKKLGEGGMGAVYLARQLSMDRLVALKVMRKNLARNREFVERFVREARLAGKLDHVNIVRALEVGESGGFHYLAMEYVEGRSLSEMMPAGGGAEEGLALRVVLQVARALGYAHQQGIVHRDIKPDNILMNGEGVAKLTDLGLAKQTGAETRITQTGVMMGTPHYVSPEQARGAKDVDIRSDIYSLGATLYHLVTGRTPFSGSSAAVVMTKHLTEQVPWPGDVNPNLSAGCCRVIERMMAKDPADRYRDPAEVIEDLELVIGGKAPLHAGLDAGKSLVGGPSAVPVKPVPGGRRPGRYRTTRYRETRGTQATTAIEPVSGRRLPLPAPLLAVLGAVGLLAVALAVWALAWPSGGDEEDLPPPPKIIKPPPPPPPTEDPKKDEKRFGEMFRYAETYWKENPEDYTGAIAKFRKVIAAAKQTVWGMKAEDAVKAVRQARAKAAEATFADLKAKAGKLAAGDDFDGALAVLARPGAFAGLLTPRIAAEREALKKRAEAKLQAAAEAAEKFSKDGEPEEGLAELEKVKPVKYAAWGQKLAALAERLEKEKQDAAALERKRREAGARKLAAAALDRFDELVSAGSYKEAARHVAAERKKVEKGLLPLVAGELEAAGKVAAELDTAKAAREKALKKLKGRKVELRTRAGVPTKGTVEAVTTDAFKVKVTFRIGGAEGSTTRTVKFADLAEGELERLLPRHEPKTADGQVALAILALGAKDHAEAEKSLAAAGEHPLVKRYRRKLEISRLGVPEAAAKEAWERDVQPLAREKYAVPEAKKLLAVLDGYAAAHGATKFAAGRKAEIEKLRGLADAAIEASPEGMTVKLKKFFKGKVVKFNPKTLQIELFYDFEDPRQLGDWWNGSQGERGGKTLLVTSNWPLPRTAAFKCPILGTLLEFEAECEPCKDPHIIWHMQALGYHLREAGKGQGCGILNGGKPAVLRGAEMKRVEFPFQAGRRYKERVAIAGGSISWSVDGKELLSAKHAPTGTRLALATMGAESRTHFDNVRIVGTLDRRWAQAVANLVGKPSPWRGTWKQAATLKERLRRPVASAFDSKRGRYVLVFRDHALRAYSMSQNKWETLSGPAAIGERKLTAACATSIYDSAKDRLFLVYLDGAASFDFTSRKWSKATPVPRGWGVSLTYGNGIILSPNWTGGCSLRLNRLDETGQKWEEKGIRMIPGRAITRRTMVYDPPRKRFILFGGQKEHEYSDTWAYDPARNAWTELKPAFHPPPRQLHELCYDSGNDLMVLHGGRGRPADKEAVSTGTWVFDAARNSWFEVDCPAKPPGGIGLLEYDSTNKCCMAWDPKSGSAWTLKIGRASGKPAPGAERLQPAAPR